MTKASPEERLEKTLAELEVGLDTNFGEFQSWNSDDLGVVVNTKTSKIVKRFRGESAWSDANRFAGDAYWAARNAE